MTSTQQFISFSKHTGEIFSIGPSQEDGYDHLPVSDEAVKPFKDFKENMVDWKVVFNKRLKNYELRRNTQDIDSVFLFSEVMSHSDGYHDVELVIDKQSKTCYINTNNLPSNIEHQIQFSITKKGDPHFLYASYNFDLREDTKFTFECQNEYSVFTKNKFVECVVREIA